MPMKLRYQYLHWYMHLPSENCQLEALAPRPRRRTYHGEACRAVRGAPVLGLVSGDFVASTPSLPVPCMVECVGSWLDADGQFKGASVSNVVPPNVVAMVILCNGL